MMRARVPRAAVAFSIGVAVVGLIGCGKRIDTESAEKSVTDFVAQNTEFTPADVTCPSEIDAKLGVEFDCTFTGPDGEHVAHLTIITVEGSNVEYEVSLSK
jgi:hypothetical protein